MASTKSTASTQTDQQPPQPHGTANISSREYIYFLPYPLPAGTPIPYSIHLPASNPLSLPTTQTEPTSTLVLTSPLNTFVDLRFFKPFRAGETTPLPNKGERERLEWAFAGHSASQAITDPYAAQRDGENGPWQGVTHSKWTHWVDSRYPVGSTAIPVDEGDMYPISPSLTLEQGSMFQPSMGKVMSHEEMWSDVEILSTREEKTRCVVLRLHDEERKARGVVVRVGQYVQGILMGGEGVCVERWEFGGEDEGNEGDGKGDGEKDGEWKRIARVGDLFLPCAVTFRPEVLRVGGMVRYHDFEWEVEEVWEW